LPYELKDLLYPQNACLLSDSEGFLFGRRQYNICAMLYQSRGQTEKALNVWQKMGSGEFKEATALDMPIIIGRQKSLTVMGPSAPAKLDRDQLNQACTLVINPLLIPQPLRNVSFQSMYTCDSGSQWCTSNGSVASYSRQYRYIMEILRMVCCWSYRQIVYLSGC
jgi:hypothetical protein